ncbi:MAG: transcription antitermination factor NusB [Deltaproteobacteria bacterium]|nr:transcription antitermination factor NusB [Deltaproteobacteria bacterium]
MPGIRHQARSNALQLLYKREVDPKTTQEEVDRFWKTAKVSGKVLEFAGELLDGIETHGDEINRLIKDALENWKAERLTVLVRGLLKLAVCEMVVLKAPPAVVIDEAVELAREFVDEESARFVNGVLDKVRKTM